MTKQAAVSASLALDLPAFSHRERHQARRLVVVIAIMSVFFGVQMAGAIWAESQVLRAEALHLLTDVAALSLAYVAMRVAIRRPTARFTYGLRRVEPVAAIFNAVLLLAATAFVVAEAIANALHGAGPRPDRMLYIAAAGLLVNGVAAWLIHGAIGSHPDHDHDHDHGAHAQHEPAEAPCPDLSHPHLAHHVHERGHGHGHVLNLRGAWLHLFGDALGSLAALMAAVAIQLGASPKVDALATFVVAAILVYGGVRLLHDAVLILLEASPLHLPVAKVRETVVGMPGVVGVDELHVWTLGAGHDAVTAHVVAAERDPTLASRIAEALRRRHHVEYVTIQIREPR